MHGHAVDVKENDSLMSEELFGPILPFLTVNSKEEALRFIKDRYSKKIKNRTIEKTKHNLKLNFLVLDQNLSHYTFSRALRRP